MNRIVQTRGMNDGLLIFDTNARLSYMPLLRVERKDISRIEEMHELCVAGKRIAREILDSGFDVKILWMRYHGFSMSLSPRDRNKLVDLCRRAIRAYVFTGNEVQYFGSRDEMLDAYGRDTAPIGKRLENSSESTDALRGYVFPPPVFRSPETDVATYLSVSPARRSLLMDDALRFLERLEEIEGVERVEFRADGLVSVLVGKAFLWSDIEPRITEALALLAGSSTLSRSALDIPTAVVSEDSVSVTRRKARRPHWKPRADAYMKFRVLQSLRLRPRDDSRAREELTQLVMDDGRHQPNMDNSIPVEPPMPQPFWPFCS